MFIQEEKVATALTVYGIETLELLNQIQIVQSCNSAYRLRYWNSIVMPPTAAPIWTLQQRLPFTVLKLPSSHFWRLALSRCNSAYRLRYWNTLTFHHILHDESRCNSAYRLRYWNMYSRKGSTTPTNVATALTVYGIETQLRWQHQLLCRRKLQQRLPFTVLKREILLALFNNSHRCNSAYRLRYWNYTFFVVIRDVGPGRLQQRLPFTVLKLNSRIAEQIFIGT